MLNIIQPSNDEEVEDINWHQIWRSSPEFQDVKRELLRLNSLPSTQPAGTNAFDHADASQHKEFVASFWTQFREVLIRTWKHFWRSPTYIWSKTILIILSVCFVYSVSCTSADKDSLSTSDSRLRPRTLYKGCRISFMLSSCTWFSSRVLAIRLCLCLFRSELCMKFVRDHPRSIAGIVSPLRLSRQDALTDHMQHTSFPIFLLKQHGTPSWLSSSTSAGTILWASFRTPHLTINMSEAFSFSCSY